MADRRDPGPVRVPRGAHCPAGGEPPRPHVAARLPHVGGWKWRHLTATRTTARVWQVRAELLRTLFPAVEQDAFDKLLTFAARLEAMASETAASSSQSLALSMRQLVRVCRRIATCVPAMFHRSAPHISCMPDVRLFLDAPCRYPEDIAPALHASCLTSFLPGPVRENFEALLVEVGITREPAAGAITPVEPQKPVKSTGLAKPKGRSAVSAPKGATKPKAAPKPEPVLVPEIIRRDGMLTIGPASMPILVRHRAHTCVPWLRLTRGGRCMWHRRRNMRSWCPTCCSMTSPPTSRGWVTC